MNWTRVRLCLCVQYFTLWSASKESQIDTNCGYYNKHSELNGLFILRHCVLVWVRWWNEPAMERMDALAFIMFGDNWFNTKCLALVVSDWMECLSYFLWMKLVLFNYSFEFVWLFMIEFTIVYDMNGHCIDLRWSVGVSKNYLPLRIT